MTEEEKNLLIKELKDELMNNHKANQELLTKEIENIKNNTKTEIDNTFNRIKFVEPKKETEEKPKVDLEFEF